jgi:hypothetical protein
MDKEFGNHHNSFKYTMIILLMLWRVVKRRRGRRRITRFFWINNLVE